VLPALIAPPLLTALWMAVSPPPPTKLDVFDLMTGDRCDGEDTGVLADVRPGRIMAPMGLAFAIAEDPRGNSVAALSFHRASPGIRRVALAFTGTDATTRREGLEPFDYVAICRRQTDIDLSPAPLFKALIEGEAVPGLDPVAPHDPSRFRLFRIDKDAPDAFALPGDKS
jgi:hypothetical protein